MFTESTQSGKRLSKRNHKQQGKDHFRVKSYDKLSERQKNLWIKFDYCRVKMANISNLGSVISNIDDIEKGNSQKVATQITNRRECQKSDHRPLNYIIKPLNVWEPRDIYMYPIYI